jgi:hypothetical protein
MSPSVFVSYQRRDSAHVSGRLRDRLIAAFGDGNVFFDVDSIPSGADFPAVIRSALRKLAYINAAVIRRDPDFHRDAERLIATLRHKGSQTTRMAGSVDSGRIPSQSHPRTAMIATGAGAPGNPPYPGMTNCWFAEHYLAAGGM